MNNTFLSYDRVRHYISLLIANGLLEPDQRQSEYKTTEKVQKLLKIYGQIQECLDLTSTALEDKRTRKELLGRG